ncbi:MAG TPA: PQQ-dependent sugar dehydrogenase [Clostridia bacterium]|nr:PQQ-dependent sugar dehydrogenase [Clostridia bacterium]
MTRRPSRHLVILVMTLLAVGSGCGGGDASAPAGPTVTARPTVTAGPAASAGGTAEPVASASPAGGAFDPNAVSLALEPFVEGLEAPLAVTHAGDGSGRLFVVEQAGRIRVVRDGTLESDPFLDITERISAGGERGLLGLAFHPEYPEDPRLFVNYTNLDGNTVVSSFTADEDAADPASEAVILRIDQPYGNHNGGAVAFGPDDFLYVSTGDGGSGGDPHDNGQRLDTLLGKILRIDIDAVDGDRRYAVPDDNPFLNEGDAAPEIWLTGLRNPWRMSFDRATGDLWLGDVGQNSREEIDVARAGRAGLNFGWNRMEGFECFRNPDCDQAGFDLPVTDYGHDLGCSVVGGIVYRGVAQPALAGGYVFADYCSGNVWLLDPAAEGRREARLVLESGITISAIGEDEAGEPLATDLRGGAVLRIVATAS